MKNWTLAILSVFIFTQTTLAAEPTPSPQSENKEVLEKAKDNGALKVEKTPAVDEESLNGRTPPPKPITTTSSSSEPHLFGGHAALGIPHPLSAGLNYFHSSHLFSVELSAGAFATTISDTKLKIQNTELALRWHPWAGSFFVGAIWGNQKINAEKTEYIAAAAQNVNAKVEVKSNYLTPHFGWAWGATTSGFFSSVEFGYQSPSGVKTDFTTDAPGAAQSTQDYKNLEHDVRDQGDKAGNMGLPHIVLYKIGWLF